MGIQNTAAKNYMSRNDISAELINYYVFQGKKVLKPEDLRDADSAESILLPDGMDIGSKRAVERYRDILKQGVFKLAGRTVFLFIGIENQTEVHYTMPVRSMLYDALNYAGQVSKLTKEHRDRKDTTAGAEFLSGMKRDDKLFPVITITVYFGQEPWSGPRSLHEMLCESGPEVLGCVGDYPLNLVDPHQMSEEDYACLGSSLQYVMRFIGASGSKGEMEKLLRSFWEQYAHMERDAAELISACTKTKFVGEEESEEVNMCKAWDEMQEECLARGREEGRQEGVREGVEDTRKQIKAAIQEIKNGYTTIEKLISRGFSKETAEDAIEIAGQFL